jgi:hypothetical protein
MRIKKRIKFGNRGIENASITPCAQHYLKNEGGVFIDNQDRQTERERERERVKHPPPILSLRVHEKKMPLTTPCVHVTTREQRLARAREVTHLIALNHLGSSEEHQI